VENFQAQEWPMLPPNWEGLGKEIEISLERELTRWVGVSTGKAVPEFPEL
jgi:hypothetical protein